MKRKVILTVTNQRIPPMSELFESGMYNRVADEYSVICEEDENAEYDRDAFSKMIFKTLDSISAKEEIVVAGEMELNGKITALRYAAEEQGVYTLNTFVFTDPANVTWHRNNGNESVVCLSASGERIHVYKDGATIPTYNMSDQFFNTIDFYTGGELFSFYSAGITGLVSGKALIWIRVEFPERV